MSNDSVLYEDLFSSLISDIKNYNGNDPLLPWLRGIRKMKESLRPKVLKEKLPRFLQKCAQAFHSDRRYTNDLRYIRVWIQLMDFVDDPKAVLRTMEAHRIGMKRSLFYQAYALYYEKMKKFEAAERMYHLGVQNLAEPAGELQKSYEQFLHRMEQHKNKKNQGVKSHKGPQPSAKNMPGHHVRCNNENLCNNEGKHNGSLEEHPGCINVESNQLLSQSHNEGLLAKDAKKAYSRANSSDGQVVDLMFKKRDSNAFGCKSHSENTKEELDEHGNVYTEDTVVVKFVDTAVVGKSDAEDARHHGLVEPTINTKEAMDAINDMFREPLEPSFTQNRSCRNHSKADWIRNNGLDILVDEKIDAEPAPSHEDMKKGPAFQMDHPKIPLTTQEPLQIFVDDVENDGTKQTMNQNHEIDQNSDQDSTEDESTSVEHFSAFVLPCPSDVSLECNKDLDAGKPYQARYNKEDTVVHRFVGSTILQEPKVENVCHHGLVEPTINLKEAMEDINSMFGKPIEFTRKSRPKKQDTLNHRKFSSGSFLILPDDEFNCPSGKSLPSSSNKKENDLFEQTICTREAIEEINKMFGMPL